MKRLIQLLLFVIFYFALSIKFSIGQASMNTTSQVNNLFDDVVFRLLLEVDAHKAEAIGLTNKKYFLPMYNYIDFNILGKGNSVKIDEIKLKNFILHQVNAGATQDDLSKSLLEAFRNGDFNFQVSDNATEKVDKKSIVKIGGFFVTEFEYHQEPDGMNHPLLEINQTRIYVSADLNQSDKKNRISFLGEWNPIAEEVVHQIDGISFDLDTNNIKLENPTGDNSVMMGGKVEYINFERLYVNIGNLINSSLNLTVGQFRNPFGIWSDYTSHRNFNSTKNNQLVNGFALKKIELGIKLDKKLKNGLDFQAALMHGRLSRTSELERADKDDMKDFCGRVGYENKTISIGASAYFADFEVDRTAFGLDYIIHTNKLSVSGELVYQRNINPSQVFDVPVVVKNISSYSGYLQFDLVLTKYLHVYGMYELWDYRINDKQVYAPEYKMFHGIRYSITNSLRWTIIEYGHMFHKNYDKGETHLSTQLELVF